MPALLSFLLLAAGLAVAPAAAAIVGNDHLLGILATVDGEPITLFDVLLETNRAEQQLAATASPTDLPEAVRRLRREAVERLIDRRLVFTEFQARSYRVPDQLLEDLLNQIAADFAGGNREALAKRAADDGMTMDELRAKAHERLAVDLLLDEYCRRSVFITPAQIQAYYDRHSSTFSEPGRISLQVLLLKKDAALAARPADFPARLREQLLGTDEANFAAMVKLYSDGPKREDGGRTGWMNDAELRPEFAAVLQNAINGEVVGPVALPEGVCFLRVIQHSFAGKLPFDAVKERIREILEKPERDRRYRELTTKLRARAVIRTFFDK